MPTGTESLYFGDTTGKTFKWSDSVYSDDGSPIAMRVKTQYYSFDEGLGGTKLLKKVQVIGDFPMGVLVSLSIYDEDGRSDYEMLGQIKDSIESVDVYEDGNGFSLGFDEISTSRVEIGGFKFHYKNKKHII
jgi:hypothetical protein